MKTSIRFACLAAASAWMVASLADALPDGYVEGQWIESSGTQWIDTQLCPNCTDKVEVKFMLPRQSSANAFLYCARGVNNANTFTCLKTSENKLRLDRKDDAVGLSEKLSAQVDHVLTVDGNDQSYCLDDNPITCKTTADFTPGGDFVLFGGYSGDKTVVSNCGSYRLYSFRVTAADGTVRADLVPCVRENDGAVGLYDLARMSFYGSSGSGTLSFRRRYPLERLPSGYLKCRWLKSSGTQWINTEFVPHSRDRIETKVVFTELKNGQHYGIYCARSAEGKRSFTCMRDTKSNFRFDHHGEDVPVAGESNCRPEVGVPYEIAADGRTLDCSVNGSPVTTMYDATYVVGSPFALFATHQGTLSPEAVAGLAKMALYYFRVKNGDGVLQAEMIPCLRTVDGAIGLYDLVNEKFLPNAGSGSFVTVLEELPEEYDACEWIESSGTQWINTRYTPLASDRIAMNFSQMQSKPSETYALYCARSADGSCSFSCIHPANQGLRFDHHNLSSSGWGLSNVQPGGRESICLEADGATSSCTTNGVHVATMNAGTFDVGSELVLLGLHSGTLTDEGVTGRVKVRLGAFRVYDRFGIPSCDCVPCVRREDGELGLFDLVNRRFLGNSGTGVFRTKRTALPAGYSPRKWILSAGKQWIDTQFRPVCTDKVEVKFMLPRQSADNMFLYCARGVNNANTFTCLKTPENKLRLDRKNGAVGTSGTLGAKEDYTLTADGNTQTCFLNESEIACTPTEGFAPGGDFVLFGGYSGDKTVVSNCGSFRLYSFTVTAADGSAQADLVPCVRDSDQKPGLYDLVNDRFLFNAGQGDFRTDELKGLLMIVR